MPATHDSAGRSYGDPGISRDGSSTLRDAIVELGRGLSQHDVDFARYRAGLLARGMKPLPAAIAVGHRAHRLAFALIRSGLPYDPDRLAQSVATGGERRKPKAGGPVKELHREAACRHDVTHPPSTTVPRQPSYARPRSRPDARGGGSPDPRRCG